jgi:histone-lysine N-methyltransferase SETD8
LPLDKGRGILAARDFEKGDFVVEYCEELIDLKEARSREAKYASDGMSKSFMYYFWHHEKSLWLVLN